jgi:alanine racemase
MRVPVVGNVAMDATMIDVSLVPGRPVDVDDEVVLIGRQGDDEVTATEWATRLDTISYEIVTGIGARVPRSYTGGTH